MAHLAWPRAQACSTIAALAGNHQWAVWIKGLSRKFHFCSGAGVAGASSLTNRPGFKPFPDKPRTPFAARSSARRRTGRRTAMRSQKSLGEVHFARPCCTPAHAAASADPAIAPREPAERTFPSPIASDISRISTRMLPSSLAAPRHGGRHGCPRDSEMLVSAARFPAPR